MIRFGIICLLGMIGGAFTSNTTEPVSAWMNGSAPVQVEEEQQPGQDAEKVKLPVLPKDTLPADLKLGQVPDGLDSIPQAPKENPLTLAKVNLGRKLFFDPVLSENNTVSCASCHQPEFGFADNNKLAVGINGKVGSRNSPTLLNRVYGESFFWDGRSESLENQALKPIESEIELGSSVEAAVERLQKKENYPNLFRAAFQDDKDPVNAMNLAKALAAFQRTLLLGNSPVDQFQSANYSALTDQERQGLWIYESRGGCWQCHSGANYSDEGFHNTGVGYGGESRDAGLEEHSGQPGDRFKFKTPTLRGVFSTAPYFHDGSAKTLEEVVEFYSKGGHPQDERLDGKMKVLNLSEDDKKHLVAFLKALSRE